MLNRYLLKESKIFDPRDPLTAAYGCELVDASVTKRGEHWWMVLAGQPRGYGATDLYSAYLPKGAALSASGWTPLLDGAGRLAPLSARNKSALWMAMVAGTALRMCRAGTLTKKLGWSAFTTQVLPRFFGAPHDRLPRMGRRAMAGSAGTRVRSHRGLGARQRLRAQSLVSRRQMEDVVRSGF